MAKTIRITDSMCFTMPRGTVGRDRTDEADCAGFTTHDVARSYGDENCLEHEERNEMVEWEKYIDRLRCVDLAARIR